MLIKNARLRDREGIWQIRIENGMIKNIEPDQKKQNHQGEQLDVAGCLVLPPFVDPHVHLDSVLTAGEPNWNESGTLFEGIKRWSERKAQLTIADVKRRVKKALKWQIANGIQYVRTHVDVTDPKLIALEALLEVKEEMSSYINLQLVSFPQEGICSFPNGYELLEESVLMGVDAVGGIPHYEFTREYGVESVKKTFELAAKHNLLIDIHCDEIDDDQSRFIEVVAAEALRLEMGAYVTASHTTAMHSYGQAYMAKLFRLLELSGINFIANPLTNIHLQGRFDNYPKRRGITRVKELIQDGLNIGFGHDNICDAWYPLGTGNMLQVLNIGLHVTQLMGYNEIKNSMDLITTNSAKAIGVTHKYGIEIGKPGNLIVLNATDEFEAIRRQSSILYSIREGKIIAQTKPSKHSVQLSDGKEEITFRK